MSTKMQWENMNAKLSKRKDAEKEDDVFAEQQLSA